VTSEGERDAEAWGPRANWCDYFGPFNGKSAGIAIFDIPLCESATFRYRFYFHAGDNEQQTWRNAIRNTSPPVNSIGNTICFTPFWQLAPYATHEEVHPVCLRRCDGPNLRNIFPRLWTSRIRDSGS
jgi:hypothetical protein